MHCSVLDARTICIPATHSTDHFGCASSEFGVACPVPRQIDLPRHAVSFAPVLCVCRRVYLAKTLTQGRPSQNRTEPSTERMYAMQFRAAFGRFQTPRSKPAFHPSLVAGTARKTFMSLVRLQQVPHTHQAPLIGKSEKRTKACTIIYGGNQIFKSCSAKGRARARVWLFCMLRYFNGPRRAVVCM